jgi:hypothetical protein
MLSCQFGRSRLQHRTSYVDCGIKTPVHELHMFLAVAFRTHSCTWPFNFHPPFHLLFRQRSVLFYIFRAPLTLFHLDALKCAPRSWCVYDVRNSSIGIVTIRLAHSLYVLVDGAGVVPFLDALLHMLLLAFDSRPP